MFVRVLNTPQLSIESTLAIKKYHNGDWTCQYPKFENVF